MPPTQRTTKSGQRNLSDVCRTLVLPTGIASTGWPAIERTSREKLGIEYDDWQHGLGRVILAKRADGSLAAQIDGVGVSVCRQVGKTYTVGGLLFALCVNIPNLLVIWSAHHARTHGETFLSMQAMAKRAKVASHVRQVFTGSGDEEIRFHNDSRILFGARERGFGRGIPGVDVLVFDEAQILSDRALANMLATMNTSRFGLALFVGTPPRPEDNSEAFRRMRADALEGRLTDGAWVEIGADQDADPKDRKQWAKANPSHPKRTPAASIQRLQRKLLPDDFLREGLGIWPELEKLNTIIDMDLWSSLTDADSQITSPLAFAVDVTPDRSAAAIAAAGLRDDGLEHVEVIQHFSGTRGVAERLAELYAAHGEPPIGIDTGSAAGSLIPDLERLEVPFVALGAKDMVNACGAFYDAVVEKRVRHLNQPPLNTALSSAKKRELAGAWAWHRRDSGDICPLVAVTLARYVQATTEKEAPLPLIAYR